MYTKSIMRTAQIECADSVIYKGGSDITYTTIGCHAFLLCKDETYYLIDTGIENINIANKTKSSKADWIRKNGEYSIKENLERMGLSSEKISKVFLTHSHYDHISGIVHFNNADIYMTKKEYEYMYSEEHAHKDVLEDVKKFLKNRNVIVFDEELFVDDIVLTLRGGHTIGSMSIQVDDVFFTGDTVFTLDNLRMKKPAGFSAFPEQAEKLIEEYSKFKGKIITSHDFNEVI